MDASQPETPPKRPALSAVRDFFKNTWRDYIFLFPFAAVIVSFDQWTKALVRANVPLGGDWLPDWLAWLMPYARIRHWHNTGAAFGMFQDGNLVFSILAVIVGLLIIYYFPRTPRQDWWLRLALALQFSGAIGNLVDRITFGRVTDFLSVGSFAIFNVADASISVGVVVLLLGVWLQERAAKKRALGIPPTEDGQPVPNRDEAKSG